MPQSRLNVSPAPIRAGGLLRFFADFAFRAAAPIRSAVAVRFVVYLRMLLEKVSYQPFPHTLYPNK